MKCQIQLFMPKDTLTETATPLWVCPACTCTLMANGMISRSELTRLQSFELLKWKQKGKSDIHACGLGRSRANLTAHWGRKGAVLAPAPDYMILKPWVWFMQSKQGNEQPESSVTSLLVLVSAWALLPLCNGPQMDEGATQRWFFSAGTQATVSEMKTLTNAFQIFIKAE